MRTLLYAIGSLLFLGAAGYFVASSLDASPPRSLGSLPGYDLLRPTASIELPDELMEISALTDIDDHTVACLEDELGVIYYVDLDSGAVSRRLPFGASGDYEGLTRVGDRLWVLRSDGLLLELAPRGDALTVARSIRLEVGHRDLEGLAYDSFRGVLLVAPKDSPSGGKQTRGQRRVFTVDPVSGKRLGPLALLTSVERIVSDARKSGIPLPTRSAKKKGSARADVKVRFSSIAVHPVTQQLYAVSAIDAGVMVFDREGRLCAAHFFDSDEMPKIEGIGFLGNGDLIVSSEGVKSPAVLRVFQYHRGSYACGVASG